MKRQVLNQKIKAFIYILFLFLILLFVNGVHSVVYAELMFIEGETTTRQIHEKEEIGTIIGEPVSAMDMGQTLEYSLSDTDPGVFEIDSSTGQLRIKARLDYETKSVHTVKVVVSDGSRMDSITVTIQVLTDIVDIPDSNLARVIRSRLGLGPDADITKKAMSKLKNLNANRTRGFINTSEVYNLTGLEHATNLTTLRLNSNSVSDLTPLKGLTKLTTLEFYGNYVVSLTPLAGLTNLKRLHLGCNGISDITPLAGLTNLRSLNLTRNKIIDITPLTELTNLRRLHLSENRIADLTPLAGLANLKTLHLAYNCDLIDVSPLAGLTNLETLNLMGCPITDFSPLVGLTATINVSVGSAPVMSVNRTDSLLNPAVLKTLDRDALQARLRELRAENDGSLKCQQAIAMLEAVLASMRPDKTELLTNYPNPFNPETWIPYQLGKSSHVQISIYDTHGIVVRHLELGHQSSGYYTSRSHAAYWDGKNDFGERVASGVYFFQLQADTISPIRKMLVLK